MSTHCFTVASNTPYLNETSSNVIYDSMGRVISASNLDGSTVSEEDFCSSLRIQCPPTTLKKRRKRSNHRLNASIPNIQPATSNHMQSYNSCDLFWTNVRNLSPTCNKTEMAQVFLYGISMYTYHNIDVYIS